MGKYLTLPDFIDCMDGGVDCSVVDEDNLQKLIDWCNKQLESKNDYMFKTPKMTNYHMKISVEP